MPELGYSLSCEENAPNDLVRFLYIHQIGQDQEGFLEFAGRELLRRV